MAKLNDVLNATDNTENGSVVAKRVFSRSTVEFPYTQMDDAVVFAQALHEAGSVPLTRDQLAARLNTTPDTSTFSIRLSGARMFGLVEGIEDGKVQITPLGHRIISTESNESAQAKVESFLAVELYRKLCDHFRGKPLPGKDGIEAAIANFGVSEKQKDKARHAFEKSAIFAGFMDSSKSRLVEPVIASSPSRAKRLLNIMDDCVGGTPATPQRNSQINILALDEPLINGMLSRLPKPGETWSLDERKKWADALLVIFSIVYKE